MVSNVLLIGALSKNCFHYSRFRGLCVNSLYLVEHVGVHILFVPEVISPAILKEVRIDESANSKALTFELDGYTMFGRTCKTFDQ